VIREAAQEEFSQLLQFVREYHQFEGVDLDEEQRSTAVQTLLADRSLGQIWLVVVGEVPVGYLALTFGYSIEFTGRDGTIDEFYISPPYRGQGLGRQVLERVIEEAKKLGLKALHLEVARTNARAQSLYLSASFAPREKYMLMSVSL
jgi:ribosomal protein S18 acetylase RimI-like enzyme